MCKCNTCECHESCDIYKDKVRYGIITGDDSKNQHNQEEQPHV